MFISKNLWRVSACLALFLISACVNKTEIEENDFALSRYSVAFPISGGVATITVNSPENWSASTDASWLALSPTASSLTITAEANGETTEVRKANVVILSESGNTLVLEAIQEPATPVSLEVACGNTSSTIDSEGGSFTVSVTCNYAWTAALVEAVDGWTLTSEEGIVRISAVANTGDSKTGIILIKAGEGELATEESVEVTQISRAENGYYQCTGDWDIYADTWYEGTSYFGEGGTYDYCTIAEFDYATAILSLINMGMSDTQMDRLEYHKGTRSFVLPGGYLVGSTMATNGYSYYLYLVPININGGFLSTDLNCTLSDDGQTITIDDMPEAYPVLGVMGYSPYLGYCLWADSFYPSGNIEFHKRDQSAPTSKSQKVGSEVLPVYGLPEGVPARIPAGRYENVVFSVN